jgi:hypothetical protein
MNERIQQLMKSAITECFDDQLDRDGDLDRMYIPNVFAERFAQSIVQECRDMFVVGSVSWNLLNDKLEHFGVNL